MESSNRTIQNGLRILDKSSRNIPLKLHAKIIQIYVRPIAKYVANVWNPRKRANAKLSPTILYVIYEQFLVIPDLPNLLVILMNVIRLDSFNEN